MAWGVDSRRRSLKHNCSKPAEHKISSKVSEDVQHTVHQDITKIAIDLLKGYCLLNALLMFCFLGFFVYLRSCTLCFFPRGYVRRQRYGVRAVLF